MLHPDEEAERDRRISIRESGEEDKEEENGDEKDDDPKVTITVKNAGGDVIRTFRKPVYQGINRVTWDMRRDGARALPGPEKQDYKDGLPAGPEVPPDGYTITLALDHPDSQATVAGIDVQTAADPRSVHSQADVEQNYAMQVDLLGLQKSVVSAVERIVRARDDVATVTKLINARQGADKNEKLIALKKQAKTVKESLDELEKRFRTPPETKGYPYTADKISSKVTMAQGYVASSKDVPSTAAKTYIDIARGAVDEGNSALNDLFAGELEEFRKAVDTAGIGLLSSID